MFKTTHTYTIGIKTYINEIFTQLPSNAFIDKGKCMIGATTLELLNLMRSSIIAVPTIGILLSKKRSHPDIFIVYELVTKDEVKDKLLERNPAQKVMTTPEGLKKIIDAAIELEMLTELQSTWYLLLDECHTAVTEAFRTGILKTFDYFWDFTHKAVLSATPYHFSDPRFNSFDYYEIRFTDKIAKITLVDCQSVGAALQYILMNADQLKGKLFVFINSVREIALLIERADIKRCSIYCANDKDGENMRNLGEFSKYYQEQPDESNFSQINFFTSRYFEGWDLYSENATIVLVTDVHKSHTKVSVDMKLVQAAGRLRNPAQQIIHLTNHHHNYTPMKTLNSFKEDYLILAQLLIDQHNAAIAQCQAIGIPYPPHDHVEKYANIDSSTKLATLNPYKFDQQISMSHSDEVYNNINFIHQAWENRYFSVHRQSSDLKLEGSTIKARKSKAQQLKDDYQTLIGNKKSSGAIQFYLGESPETSIRKSNELAYQASKLLDKDTMERLGYNIKKVTKEVIIASNAGKELKLLQLLNESFNQGERHKHEQISSKLQEIYNRLDIVDPKTNKVRVATATQLGEDGRFDIKPCKIPNGMGGYDNGYQLLRAQFSLRTAA